jgi:pyrroloquinoline quinone (PQQ) biosynthesis protein C
MQDTTTLSVHERLVLDTEASRNTFLSIPIIKRALRGEVTHAEYLAFLGQAYHHVRWTVPLLMGMGYHLPERLRWLQPAVAEYIEEEQGHDAWILDDIRACGGDAEAVRKSSPLPATELMVAYAHDTIQRRNPVGFLGMVFVLEGTSAQLATRAAAAIQQALGVPKTALRYLTSHGALDQEHVGFFEQLVNRLEDEHDVADLTHAANVFYRLYGDVFHAVATATRH